MCWSPGYNWTCWSLVYSESRLSILMVEFNLLTVHQCLASTQSHLPTGVDTPQTQSSKQPGAKEPRAITGRQGDREKKYEVLLTSKTKDQCGPNVHTGYCSLSDTAGQTSHHKNNTLEVSINGGIEKWLRLSRTVAAVTDKGDDN